MVDHGDRPVGLDPNGVDHQRIALVMANRITVPGRRDARGMAPIHPDVTDLMVRHVKDHDTVRLLQHLHAVI
jgi:hypothetical protein